MQGARGRIEEIEVGDEGVEESRGEGGLRREAVADGEASAFGEFCEFAACWPVGGGIH